MSLVKSLRSCRLLTRSLHSSNYILAGHSKWQNIRHDKAKNDAKKSREAFSLASRIVSSVKTGGVDGNAQLVTLFEKAKKLNINKKIIDNAVKRGLGETTGDEKLVSPVTYEFMGPGGVAIIIEAETDNKTRTIGLVKHALSKFNASLSPCLYLFERKGIIIVAPLTNTQSLDDVLDIAIEVGAEDVEEFHDINNEYNESPLYQLTTEPNDINRVSNELSALGYQLKDINIHYTSSVDNQVEFPKLQEKAFNKCLDMLDDISEITEYYTNIKQDVT